MKTVLSTRVLLTCAAIGAAGGILVVGLNYASIGSGPFALFLYGATIGLWVLPQLVAQALLRLPFVGVLTSFVMAIINAPLAPFGFAQIPSILLFGLIIELPFAVLLYRRWSARVFWIAHPLSLLVATSMYYLAIDLSALSPWLVIGMWVLAVLGALAFTGLAQLIASRLRKAGVGAPRRTGGATAAATADES